MRFHDGDRVEIYRPLIADPKELRRQRARKKERREVVSVGIKKALNERFLRFQSGMTTAAVCASVFGQSRFVINVG
nr:yfjF [Raoultella sp. NCTC 9187]